MKTRSRWERLRRKEEDGDAQAGEKEEKWFLRRRKKKKKEKKEKERKGKEMSGRLLRVFLNTQKGRNFNEIPKIPLLQIKGYYILSFL